MWIKYAAAAAMLLATPASAQSLADQQQADIAFVRMQYVQRERAFTAQTRLEADRLLAALDARAGALTPAQLFLGVAEAVAAADNAHSIAGPGERYRAEHWLPLTLSWFDDAGLVVLRALPPHHDLAGGVILEIGGRPAAQAVQTFRRYYGGTQARRNILGVTLMHGADFLVAAGVTDAPESTRLRVRLRDGSEVERDVASVPGAARGRAAWWPSRNLLPDPILGDQTPWATAIQAGEAPLYLRDGDAFNRAMPLPALDAVYLDLRTNEAEREARQFAARARAVLRQSRASNIILDLRFNKGGDIAITGAFFQQLARHLGPEGRLFVIVGRYTFSAGMGSAAIALNAAGERGVLVGEDIGDRPRFWSEGDVLCTPNSGICTRYTDGLFDMTNGCAGEPHCFGLNRRFNLRRASWTPDLLAPMTWADYLAGRDPAMDAIAVALSRQ